MQARLKQVATSCPEGSVRVCQVACDNTFSHVHDQAAPQETSFSAHLPRSGDGGAPCCPAARCSTVAPTAPVGRDSGAPAPRMPPTTAALPATVPIALPPTPMLLLTEARTGATPRAAATGFRAPGEEMLPAD